MVLVTCQCAYRLRKVILMNSSTRVLVEILATSALVQVLMTRSWADPCGSSERPLHDLAQVLMRRSCADSGEVLSEGFFA